MTDRYEPDRAAGIEAELNRKYHESTRRKVLEKQYRESVQRPLKVTFEEVMLKVDKLQRCLDTYTLEIAENLKRIEKAIGGK